MIDQENDNSTPHHFRACQHCGQLTAARSPECAHCGTVKLVSTAEAVRLRRDERFIRAFLSRATPAVYAILGLNLLIFGLMIVSSTYTLRMQMVIGADPQTLKAFGAKTNELLTRGEYFRFVTPIFIHIGLLHLVVNSYALWNIGPIIEKLYGTARFALMYLLAGIGGVLGSYLNPFSSRHSIVPGAGASGALFGLCGVLLIFGYKYRDDLPEIFRRASGSSIIPVILLNLVIGFWSAFIDNAAHIGGLVAGIALALIIPWVRPGTERHRRRDVVVTLLCVSVVAWSFGRAWQQSSKHLPQKRGPAKVASVNAVTTRS